MTTSTLNLSPRSFQKQEDVVTVFWDRQVSPWFTRAFVRLGITPNQATVLWGLISVANSYTVYLALTGAFLLIPVVFAVYLLASIIDCADGEVARATNTVNPVAGKLLDGVCHRATEYSLLGVFGVAAWTLSGSLLALPITVLLLAGDAMYSYVYERRISILRVQQNRKGHVSRSAESLYRWGTPWRSLTTRQKLATLMGLFHYKSVYPVIALAYVSDTALLAGLAALAGYKHWKWLRLLGRTLAESRSTGDSAP